MSALLYGLAWLILSGVLYVFAPPYYVTGWMPRD
jgi:hypothetical protein